MLQSAAVLLVAGLIAAPWYLAVEAHGMPVSSIITSSIVTCSVSPPARNRTAISPGGIIFRSCSAAGSLGSPTRVGRRVALETSKTTV